jgi:acyl carrier protein
MSLREVIVSHIERVAREQNKKIAALTDDTVLLDSGLDSLCFAVLFAHLEDELGLYPFSDSASRTFPITLDDLVRAYDNVART